MKIKKVFIFGCIFLWTLNLGLLSPEVFGQKVKSLIEIEKDHLYMIGLGSQDGARKGDAALIFRDNQKIAEVRLNSVLVDSAVIEIRRMFKSTNILATDTIKFRRTQSPAVSKKPIAGIPTATTRVSKPDMSAISASKRTGDSIANQIIAIQTKL